MLGPILASLCALLLACGAASGSPPNVVIALTDQLRKDAADSWMPQTNALAAKGIAFEAMRSAAPWTYPSVISLMSGLHPQQHGADGHPSEDRLARFDPELPLLPGLLREAGFHTAGFVANPFFQPFNPFHEGFDHYDIGFVENVGSLRAGGKIWSREGMFADRVNAAVRAHFDARPREGPEFTYVHYIDVHGPWDGAPFEPNYPAAVAFVDARIAELYAYFHARYDGDLIFVATSDHGVSLGNDIKVGEGTRFRKKKKSMHDFNLRIPLVILPGTRVPGPRRVAQPSSNVDLAPTLLDWLGVAAPAAMAGKSLLPLIRGEPDRAERAVYARNDAFGFRTDALVWRGHKYVRYFDLDGGETARRHFDLESDPHETRPRRDSFGDAARLLEELSGTRGVAYEAVFEDLDPDVRRQLEALGYLR